MELKWAHYCVGMTPNGWGVDVVGIIEAFGADPGQPLQLRPGDPFNLGVRIHAPTGTAPDGHVLGAIIKDTNGKALSDTRSVPLEFIPLPGGNPLVGLGRVPLGGWALPSVGQYIIDLAVDGTPLAPVPLVIIQRQRKVPPSSSAGAPPLRLNWAHYVMFYDKQSMPGLLNLAGVFDFLPAVMGANLKAGLLVLQIESDLTIHTQRQLKVELVDRNNQPARDARGRLIMAPIVRPIRLQRKPEWNFLLSTATGRFNDGTSLPPGEYRFRFYVDGQPLGEPLDLTVLPP